MFATSLGGVPLANSFEAACNFSLVITLGRPPIQFQLIDLTHTAETLLGYVQRARLGMAAQNKGAELGLRAERKLGDFHSGSRENRVTT